jgi:hypothetical protein
MVFNVAPLLCPFIIALEIFTLKKDTAKQHCNSTKLNVPNNASLAILLGNTSRAVAGDGLHDQ